ncbi:hypothetical protein GBA63_14790 [Rubrobacter tropicus]|uniref:Sulfotransferase n=1 Tax=Rubrobacter tropicus TaxID=2653851 RepID=A0A6G8QBE4_9ACTN|nr:hypothetical protein [Rubrobacter tropicus]QIN83758.1 hypothetical protein GBA63_14790 [Rubrobacter tropicus]
MRGSDVDLPAKAWDPVCVTGMHGSGGPMVAQLLYRLGLDLGDAPLVAGPADPETPWSSEAFVRVNEGILRARGGDWDVPPAPGRGQEEGIGALRREAESLIGGFWGREPWGWEDPRSSLTLPFWLDLVPEMKVVVCVRNPLEAADALREQGVTSLAFGLNLWKAYNERLLEALPEGRYVVTHHDAYLYRPQAEIRRVLDSLGMTASDQLISLVRSRVVRRSRYRFFSLEELESFDRTGRLKELYLQTCDAAEWNPDPTSSPVLAR